MDQRMKNAETIPDQPPKQTHRDQRRCVVCRRTADKSEFWRIVRNFPDHQITLHQGMGRSVYLCPTQTCLTAAEKKDRLSRSLKAPVPAEIYQKLHQILENPLTSESTRVL